MTTLVDEITQFIQQSVDPMAGDGSDFDQLAARLWEHQSDRLPVLRRYASRTGRAPGEITPLPVAAFKYGLLHDGVAPPVHVFESSGTSGAAKSRSVFSEPGLALMDAAIDALARRWLFPDQERTVILVLAPPLERAPGMIMAYGMRRLIGRFGREGSGFFVGEGGLDLPRLASMLAVAARTGTPVTLIGATFGVVHLLDALTASGTTFALSSASRLLDAGGFKGKSRVVTRPALEAAVQAAFGITPERQVNLLGMTELASQFYDGMLTGDGRHKQNAPWTRTRVVDPWTLLDAAPGEVGLLAHYDLANVERPFAVLTDDLGRRSPEGFEVLGRASEADGKGCSITLDELLSGQGR